MASRTSPCNTKSASDTLSRGEIDPGSAPRGLYVHIPFCSVKCFYCDFTAFSGQGSAVPRYLRALEKEAALRSEAPTHTLYIGGGTPSELSADQFSELFRIVESFYGRVADFEESTVEVNPESVTPAKLDVLAKAGISRLSLGLQTAEPRLLKMIGRRHSMEDFLTAYRAARSRGFSLNVDLMIGLPTQTLKEAMDSLEAVLRLEPDHISQYSLQVEDQTLFARREVEVDEDLCREMFERSLDRLGEAGFRHYEISNFARPGQESIHNEIYWRHGEYIGLGCGASGNMAGTRYSNHDRLKDYCETVERGDLPEAGREMLHDREKLGEFLFVGLRLLEGVPLTQEIRSAFPHELRHLRDQGWVSEDGGKLRLTREGVFLANRVFEEFVPPFRSPSAI